MSDTPITSEPENVDGNPVSTDAAPAPAQETDWKAEARKWEARAKQNVSAAEELEKIREAQKSEEQKRAEREAALEKELSEYKTREQVAKWKSEVSEATGVPAAVLAGSSLEEIQAHAEVLKPLITQPPAKLQPVPGEGTTGALPLNGDGIESALKNALGIR
ncbi:hypothetical protein [Microbacterium sp. KNMS]